MVRATDPFLLEVAGISASLLGFFVVGVFFYVERSIFPQALNEAQQYLKSSVRTIILLYGMAVTVSLGLVAFTSGPVSIVYLVLSAGLVWSVVDASAASVRLQRSVGARIMSRSATWSAAAVVVTFPWILGGVAPSRSDLTWGVLLIALFAFMSTASLVLSTFDIAALESSARDAGPSAPAFEHEDAVLGGLEADIRGSPDGPSQTGTIPESRQRSP